MHKPGKRKHKPPKPPNSFICYRAVMVRDPSFRAANSSAKQTELSKIIGEMWKALPEGERAPFKRMAEVEKGRVEREAGEDEDERALGMCSDDIEAAPLGREESEGKMTHRSVHATIMLPAAGETSILASSQVCVGRRSPQTASSSAGFGTTVSEPVLAPRPICEPPPPPPNSMPTMTMGAGPATIIEPFELSIDFCIDAAEDRHYQLQRGRIDVDQEHWSALRMRSNLQPEAPSRWTPFHDELVNQFLNLAE